MAAAQPEQRCGAEQLELRQPRLQLLERAGCVGDLDLHRVEAATLVGNVPSQRVLEKNGFERIGLARRFLRIGDNWRDFLLFQRLAED